MRKVLVLAASLGAALLVAGCGSGYSSSGGSSSSSSSSAGGASAAADVLTTWEGPLGTIVVTGQGRAVYVFDKDTAGASASACTGSCAGLWPAVTTTSSSPAVSGVTGQVGTAPGPGGAQQVTLDGHRLYTYSGDTGAQQTNGQAFMGIWWVVAPDGSKVTSSSSAPVQQPSY